MSRGTRGKRKEGKRGKPVEMCVCVCIKSVTLKMNVEAKIEIYDN